MQPFATFRDWTRRAGGTRTGSFLRLLFKHFFDDNCLLTAGALSYTSLLAVVPLTASVLGVIAMFPIYQRWGDALTIFLFHHFVPKSAENVTHYVRMFASSARGLTGFGATGVLVTSLFTMSSIEDAFNRIWRVPKSRRPLSRFLMYCTALTFGPLLAVLCLAMSSYLLSLPVVVAAKQASWARFGLHLVLVLIEWIALGAAYKVIPNCKVRWRHALAGGALATLLFECAKYAIAYYLKHASYEQIYGALAAIPIFLLWIWVSWLVILLGATFTAVLAAFREQPSIIDRRIIEQSIINRHAIDRSIINRASEEPPTS